MAEEGEEAWRSVCGGTFEAWVALTDIQGRYKDCTAKGDRGDDAEDLKLGFPKPREYFWKVYVAGEEG